MLEAELASVQPGLQPCLVVFCGDFRAKGREGGQGRGGGVRYGLGYGDRFASVQLSPSVACSPSGVFTICAATRLSAAKYSVAVA
jgi:hypothetical protein